jgi:hypothetical protein
MKPMSAATLGGSVRRVLEVRGVLPLALDCCPEAVTCRGYGTDKAGTGPVYHQRLNLDERQRRSTHRLVVVDLHRVQTRLDRVYQVFLRSG